MVIKEKLALGWIIVSIIAYFVMFTVSCTQLKEDPLEKDINNKSRIKPENEYIGKGTWILTVDGHEYLTNDFSGIGSVCEHMASCKGCIQQNKP